MAADESSSVCRILNATIAPAVLYHANCAPNPGQRVTLNNKTYSEPDYKRMIYPNMQPSLTTSDISVQGHMDRCSYGWNVAPVNLRDVEPMQAEVEAFGWNEGMGKKFVERHGLAVKRMLQRAVAQLVSHLQSGLEVTIALYDGS